jgi:hypothetical protein
MAKPLWLPGTSPYAEWLRTLTPEEKAEHLVARKVKKSMRKAMQEVIEANQAEWTAKINNAMAKVLEKALLEGDAQSLAIVYDRLVGKPREELDVTSNGNEIKAPTLIFKPQNLDDWTE